MLFNIIMAVMVVLTGVSFWKLLTTPTSVLAKDTPSDIPIMVFLILVFVAIVLVIIFGVNL